MTAAQLQKHLLVAVRTLRVEDVKAALEHVEDVTEELKSTDEEGERGRMALLDSVVFD